MYLKKLQNSKNSFGGYFSLETLVAGGSDQKSFLVWKSIHRIFLSRQLTNWKVAAYEDPLNTGESLIPRKVHQFGGSVVDQV